jgi:hypothetical protein
MSVAISSKLLQTAAAVDAEEAGPYLTKASNFNE